MTSRATKSFKSFPSYMKKTKTAHALEKHNRAASYPKFPLPGYIGRVDQSSITRDHHGKLMMRTATPWDDSSLCYGTVIPQHMSPSTSACSSGSSTRLVNRVRICLNAPTSTALNFFSKKIRNLAPLVNKLLSFWTPLILPYQCQLIGLSPTTPPRSAFIACAPLSA